MAHRYDVVDRFGLRLREFLFDETVAWIAQRYGWRQGGFRQRGLNFVVNELGQLIGGNMPRVDKAFGTET